MNSNKYLYVVTGIPGAGKSTFLKPLAEGIVNNVAVVSRDEIRFSLVAEDEEYFSKESQVFRTFVREIENKLKDHQIVVADATHLNEASRSKLINAVSRPENCELVSLFFDVPVGTCLSQNEKRKGTRSYVPPSAIRRMGNQLTMPSYSEGFNTIYLYNQINGVTELKKEN